MRVPALLLAFAALVGAAPVDHSRTVVATADDGFRMGNPAATVRLVEYLSLTCGHCATFHAAGLDALKTRHVARGTVSYEVRNLVLNGPDFAATLIARCDGPRAFFARYDAFLRRQNEWIAPFKSMTSEQMKAISLAPKSGRMLAMARAGRLDAFAAKLGVAPNRFARCFGPAAEAAVGRLREGADRRGVQGTPTFFINDAAVGTNTWAGIEPLLSPAR